MKSKDTQEKTTQSVAAKQPLRRMNFFLEFLNSAGISYAEAADLISYSRVTINSWITKDDARLSLVQSVIENAGYTLEINMTREEDEALYEKPISVEDFIMLEKGTYKPKRLTFLLLALKRYGIAKVDLAKALGLEYTSIRYHFFHDDMTIAMMFDIARVLDMSLSFVIKKISVDESAKKGKVVKPRRYCTVAVEKLTVTELTD